VSWLRVELDEGRASFRPGEVVRGTASWSLDAPPAAVEVRLIWFTQGKGDRDVGLVESVPAAAPGAEGGLSFAFTLPDGPYSFSGTLVSLLWAVEAVALPASDAASAELVVSPSGREILLPRETPDAGAR
jgi:hypothetical protein